MYDKELEDGILMNARMEDIKEEGIKKGKLEGLKEGKLEGKLEGIITVAKEMLKRKVSINDISLYLDYLNKR